MTSYTNSPRGVVKSVGNQDYKFVPSYIRPRDPFSPTAASRDIKPKEQQGYYPISSLWTNSVNGNVWVLAGITSNLAKWILLSSGSSGPAIMFPVPNGTSPVTADPSGNVTLTSSGGTITITGGTNSINFDLAGGSAAIEKVQGDDGINVVPTAGIVKTFGSTVTNATHAKPVFFLRKSATTDTEELDVQVATTSASGAKNINNAGLASFDSAAFTVDAATGFIGLVGGSSPPTLGLVPDAHTAPGTTPVTPNGSGNIILEGGATFATGTQAHPIRTNSLAANTIDLQIQLAGSNAGSSTPNDFGVAQFDSNQFSVASGFVQLAGGTGAAIQKVNLQTGTTPIVPSSGAITFNGATVAAGTNPVRTDGTGANTMALEVQTSQAIAASDATKIGLCNFNSAQFTVDANGFVSSTNGFGPNSTIQLADDFIGCDTGLDVNNFSVESALTWYNTDGAGSRNYKGIVATSNGHPGLIANNSTVSPGWEGLYLLNSLTGPATVQNMILGGGAIQLNWVINTAILSNGTNRYILRIGMGDTHGSAADLSNGVYFEYSDNINSGNWTVKTANGGARTTNNTSTAVGTGFVNLGITINAAASSVAYTVNGVAVTGSPIATNIPTAAISPFLKLTPTAGTTADSTLIIDLFYMTQTLTTPR